MINSSIKKARIPIFRITDIEYIVYSFFQVEYFTNEEYFSKSLKRVSICLRTTFVKLLVSTFHGWLIIFIFIWYPERTVYLLCLSFSQLSVIIPIFHHVLSALFATQSFSTFRYLYRSSIFCCFSPAFFAVL